MTNKYHAKRIQINGIQFDSIKESQRYAELKLMERTGQISNLSVHPTFVIVEGFEWHGEKVRPVKYEADFKYIENGKDVVEDVKGIMTDTFKIKIKLFKSLYPDIDFRIVT